MGIFHLAAVRRLRRLAERGREGGGRGLRPATGEMVRGRRSLAVPGEPGAERRPASKVWRSQLDSVDWQLLAAVARQHQLSLGRAKLVLGREQVPSGLWRR